MQKPSHIRIGGEIDLRPVAAREENRVEAQEFLIRHRVEIEGMLK